jgi:hypothetical protein
LHRLLFLAQQAWRFASAAGDAFLTACKTAREGAAGPKTISLANRWEEPAAASVIDDTSGAQFEPIARPLLNACKKYGGDEFRMAHAEVKRTRRYNGCDHQTAC